MNKFEDLFKSVVIDNNIEGILDPKLRMSGSQASIMTITPMYICLTCKRSQSSAVDAINCCKSNNEALSNIVPKIFYGVGQ